MEFAVMDTGTVAPNIFMGPVTPLGKARLIFTGVSMGSISEFGGINVSISVSFKLLVDEVIARPADESGDFLLDVRKQ